jgi:hypothetical protein
MPDELAQLKQVAEEASKLVGQANDLIAAKRQEILVKKAEFVAAIKKLENELQELNFIEVKVKGVPIGGKPLLVLPRLLADHSDVDPACRSHLDAQAEQIIDVFKKLTTPEKPFVHSYKIKEYILANFEIESQDYWMSRTSPTEPERWWKNIYDKAIERLDLVLGKIVRKTVTGKKGVYALKEYYDQKKSNNTLFE